MEPRSEPNKLIQILWLICFSFVIVFQRHVRSRSYPQINRNESEILLPSWMEYIRFHYSGLIVGGVLLRRNSGTFSITIIPIG